MNILLPQSLSPESFFSSLFQQMGEGAYVLDGAGQILLANTAASQILGWSQNELQERPIKELISTIDTQAVQTDNSVIRGEANVIHKAGRPIWLSYALSRIEPVQNDLFILTFHDITEKKYFEQELQNDLILFKAMADSVGILLWMFDPEGKVLYFNRFTLEFLGVPFDVAKHRLGAIEEFGDNAIGGFVHPDDIQETSEKIGQALLTRGSFRAEHRGRYKNGEYRWLVGIGGPVYSEEGEYLGLVGSSTDIHDRKIAEVELARYAQQLAQSNKDLEHFATIASHDLQEPLRKVRLFSDHLQNVSKETLSNEALDDLKRIHGAIGKMQRLIDDLLDLSRISRRGQSFKKVNLTGLVEEVIAELHYQYPDIRNQLEVNGEMSLKADPNQLKQMMGQLLDNALKFHKPDQPPNVKVDIQPEKEGYCRISIQDNGIGMKPEYVFRIFDIFTRLHHGTEYPGTGIGLALVKKIVDRHNGTITVNSTPGEGSVFNVILPIAQEQPI